MDFLLKDKGDGGEFVPDGADIKNDDTFYTAIYLSLFCGDCFYNIYSEYRTDESVENALNQTITAQNLKNVQTVVQNALRWMIEQELTEFISVRAFGDRKEKINVEITVKEPDGVSHKYAITWINEKIALNRI